ncbi:MAG: bifunctional precorrin-2 dehydrogenase/sirohydrochlorin ferrochelatase [Bacillota bacterium]|nr:bifunctional precorrin-2 dehydrogenase/sirohydrochlorin ferrochelatase [Bacillota bacterium]
MYTPLFIDISQWKILVVGGGETALRKTRQLLAGGANVLQIAPERCSGWQELAITWQQREYEGKDLVDKDLVIAATNDGTLNKKITAAAKEKGIHCNCASFYGHGDVIMPGVVQENGITIAVSTNGQTPFIAKRLKDDAKAITEKYTEEGIKLLGSVRKDIIERYPEEKKELLAKLSATPIEILKEKGSYHEITDWLQRQ